MSSTKIFFSFDEFPSKIPLFSANFIENSKKAQILYTAFLSDFHNWNQKTAF